MPAVLRPQFLFAAAVVCAAGLLPACAPDLADGPTVSLNADEQRGQQIAEASGCMACHAPGSVAADFVGLAGSTVQLADGSTIIADTAYLTQSIKDPNAKRVAGYDLPMPPNLLSDEDVALVVAYIEALGRA